MKIIRNLIYSLIFVFAQSLIAQSDGVIHPVNPHSGEQFGRSLAFGGQEWLFSGAISNDKGEASGSVYVFRNTNNQWLQSQKMIPLDARADDYFGLSIAAYANKSIVTAYKNDEGGTNAGAAYYYQETGGKWNLRQKLIPVNSNSYQLFGSAVAMTEQTALISAVGDSENGFQSGAVYAYNLLNNEWLECQKLIAPNGGPNDEFGNALSITGNIAVIGAWGSLNKNGKRSGAVYIYMYNGKQWVLQQQLFAPEGENDDRFGWSLSIKEGVVAIGAPGSDESGKDMGAVYLFTRQNNEWVYSQKIVPQGGIHGAGLGIKVLIAEGKRIWVSAEKTRTALGTSGSVYSYVPDGVINDKWTQEILTMQSQDYTHARYGSALAVNHDKLAIGAYLASVNSVDKCGSVVVYGTEAKSKDLVDSDLITDFIRVYPNPSSSGIFYVETDEISFKNISVYNSVGVLVFTIDTNNEHITNKSIHQIELSTGGVYFVHITTTDGTNKVYRLVKI